MHRDSFNPVIKTGVFSELFGFVITDPESLEQFHKRSVIGVNLLDLYTRTDDGENVSEVGAAIPIIGVKEGYYSVIFRKDSDETLLPEEPRACSSGWILNVTSGFIAFCGIGYLNQWNPRHEAVRHVAIPKGWYSVEVLLGASINDDDFAMEIVLSPSGVKPIFKADVTKSLEAEGD